MRLAWKIVRELRSRVDPERRMVAHLRRREPALLFQPFPTTREDRYPEVFAAVARALDGISRPRVLSFGCSDGSEVFSLRTYLPRAELVGVDINARRIAAARRRLARAPDPLISFRRAGELAPDDTAGFDAVVAMAVFRHGDLERAAPDTCGAIMPFERFARGVAMLDEAVRPGGWLAIWNAHFRFRDTLTAAHYTAGTLPGTRSDPLNLLYGTDDRRLEATYSEVLFRKQSDMPTPQRKRAHHAVDPFG